TARVVKTLTDTRADGKEQLRGLNMVGVYTWTDAGRLVLGTRVALGAEQWAALELIEEVFRFAKDGMHGVIWDRVITGWLVDYLMATMRLQTVGKPVANSRDDSSEIDDRIALKAAAHHTQLDTHTKVAIRYHVLAD